MTRGQVQGISDPDQNELRLWELRHLKYFVKELISASCEQLIHFIKYEEATENENDVNQKHTENRTVLTYIIFPVFAVNLAPIFSFKSDPLTFPHRNSAAI